MSLVHWLQLAGLSVQCVLLVYVIRLRRETKRNADRSEAALARVRARWQR